MHTKKIVKIANINKYGVFILNPLKTKYIEIIDAVIAIKI